MIRRAALLAAATAALVLAGCQDQSTWYEERCERIGLKKGSKDFNDCTARDVRWIEGTQAPARGHTRGGP